jgi:hypothetical protein
MKLGINISNKYKFSNNIERKKNFLTSGSHQIIIKHYVTIVDNRNNFIISVTLTLTCYYMWFDLSNSVNKLSRL